ncbi:hypothetical protein Bca101_042681 [Brassica carinata]
MVDTNQFRSKEAETASLKNQLKDLQSSLESMVRNQRRSDTYFNPLESTSIPTYQGSYSPGFLSGYQTPKSRSPLPGFLSSDEIFTSRYGSTSAAYPKTKPVRSKSRRQKDSEFQDSPFKKQAPTPALTSSSSHESVDEKKKGHDIGIIEFSMTSLLNTLGDSSAMMTNQLQSAQKDPQASKDVAKIKHLSDTSSDGYVMVFTFDDIPFNKWNDRLDEFHAWMSSEAITSPLHLVIQQFTARLSGALKEWWNSLGEYRQHQVYQTTIPLLLGEIHREFIGTPTHQKEQIQEEFFSAKCCSLQKKDLAKHFERQTRRYYALNGLNNPSLKHVYLSSIDDYLSQQTKLTIPYILFEKHYNV